MPRTFQLFRRYALGHVLLGGLALSACSTGAGNSTPVPNVVIASPAATARPATSAAAAPAAAATVAAAASGRPTTGSAPSADGCSWNTHYPHTLQLEEISRQDGGVLGMFTSGHWACGATPVFTADGPSRPMTIAPGAAVLATAPLTGDAHPTPISVDQLISAAKQHPRVAFEADIDAQGRVVRLESIYQG